MNIRPRFSAPLIARSLCKQIVCLASQWAAESAEEMGPNKNVKATNELIFIVRTRVRTAYFRV